MEVMELEVLESMELEVLESEVINQVEVIGLDEIISQIEEILISINDIRDVVILIFGFVIGYIVIRDFINNIMKSV